MFRTRYGRSFTLIDPRCDSGAWRDCFGGEGKSRSVYFGAYGDGGLSTNPRGKSNSRTVSRPLGTFARVTMMPLKINKRTYGEEVGRAARSRKTALGEGDWFKQHPQP